MRLPSYRGTRSTRRGSRCASAPRPGLDAADVRDVVDHASTGAGADDRWLRRPGAGARVEPRLRRRRAQRSGATSAWPTRSSGRSPSWQRLRRRHPPLATAEFHVSHEALLLDYERALTRTDPQTGRSQAPAAICCGWGAPRRPDGAHIDYAAGCPQPGRRQAGSERDGGHGPAVRRPARPGPEPGRPLTFVVRMGRSGSGTC